MGLTKVVSLGRTGTAGLKDAATRCYKRVHHDLSQNCLPSMAVPRQAFDYKACAAVVGPNKFEHEGRMNSSLRTFFPDSVPGSYPQRPYL